MAMTIIKGTNPKTAGENDEAVKNDSSQQNQDGGAKEPRIVGIDYIF